MGIAGGSEITETLLACTPFLIGRLAGNGGCSSLLLPNDRAEPLILSRVAVDGTGGRSRGSSDCRDRSVE